jgi:hypothetical protein
MKFTKFVCMERLTINIPESKSAEIKSFLKSMGVAVDGLKVLDMGAYREKIANIGIWSDDDLKVFEESRKASIALGLRNCNRYLHIY